MNNNRDDIYNQNNNLNPFLNKSQVNYKNIPVQAFTFSEPKDLNANNLNKINNLNRTPLRSKQNINLNANNFSNVSKKSWMGKNNNLYNVNLKNEIFTKKIIKNFKQENENKINEHHNSTENILNKNLTDEIFFL